MEPTGGRRGTLCERLKMKIETDVNLELNLQRGIALVETNKKSHCRKAIGLHEHESADRGMAALRTRCANVRRQENSLLQRRETLGRGI